jgi:hypothetical protein
MVLRPLAAPLVGTGLDAARSSLEPELMMSATSNSNSRARVIVLILCGLFVADFLFRLIVPVEQGSETELLGELAIDAAAAVVVIFYRASVSKWLIGLAMVCAVGSVALRLGAGSWTAGLTGAQDPGEWAAGKWEGQTNRFKGDFFNCEATFNDTTERVAFVVTFRSIVHRAPENANQSSVYVHFLLGDSNYGNLDGLKGASAAYHIGASLEGSGKITDSPGPSFEIELPLATIDALETGGTFNFELPNGSYYGAKVSPSRDAMAIFKKCIAANRGR